MSDYHYMVKASVTETGLQLALPSDELVKLDIPGFKDLGIDASDADTFHGYVRVHQVVDGDHIRPPNLIWQNLKEEPFPAGAEGREDVVQSGDRNTVGLLGDVTHHVDEENRAVINITTDDHRLHPGIVARQFFEHEGQSYIATIGIGNGDFPGLNTFLSDRLWGRNVEDITLESIEEYKMVHQAHDNILSAEETFNALRGPMSEEFLTNNPEVAALKNWVDMQGMADAEAYKRFVETYDELVEQGSYHNLESGIMAHQQNMMNNSPAPESSPMATPDPNTPTTLPEAGAPNASMQMLP